MKATKTKARAVSIAPQKLSASWEEGIFQHQWKIIAVITLFAFLLRVWRVGFLSLWIDEFVHAIPAKQFLETGRFSVTDNNGILLTWINCLLVKLLGLSAFVLRLPLVISGTLLVPVAYVFGKKLFGTAAGIVTAILVCFSPFLIFWSRIDRMYEFVSLFYLLTLLCFWLIVEDAVTVFGFARKTITVRKPWLLAALFVSLLLSFLSQLQAVFFLLTIGFYGSFVRINGVLAKNKNGLHRKIYRWLMIANIIGLLLFFTPLTNLINKPIVSMINGNDGFATARIPGWIAGMLAPDWNAFGAFLSSDKWLTYINTYYRVTMLDYPLLGLAGWAGFILAFFNNRKAAYYLASAFIAPLLVMGFFLREPNEPRYLCFIYPVFLCAAAVSVVTVCLNWLPRVSGKNRHLKYRNVSTVVAFALLLLVLPFKSVFTLILSEKHGHQLQRELTEPAIVNWKEPGMFVKEHIRKGDLVFSTVSGVADFYVGANSLPFRQFFYSLEQKKYLPNPTRRFVAGANIYEEFVETMKTHPRGWLLLDHYLYTSYVDPRVTNYIHQYCTYHPEASHDGSVQVFSWDKDSMPTDNATQYVIELGKDFSLEQIARTSDEEDHNQYSDVLKFPSCNNCDSMEIRFFTRNIDYPGEASIIINDKKRFVIPTPADASSGKSSLLLSLAQWGIAPGTSNTARFMYTPPEDPSADFAKGYFVKAFYFISK